MTVPDFGAQQAEKAQGIADAITEVGFETDEGEENPANAEFDDPESEQDASQVGAESTTPEDAEAEPPAEGEEQPDAPEEYWGIPLDGVPAEKRAEIIAGLEQRDSTIHKLQEQMAALRQSAEDAPAPVDDEAIEDVDDETLLRAAGYDPEDYKVQELAPVVLPMLRRELALEGQVEALAQARQVESVEQQWNTQLDQLEAQYGKIPFERDDVLRYAVDQSIGSPYEAYFRLAAPARQEVSNALSALKKDVEKRVVSGGVKPQSRKETTTPPITKDMSMREAVKQAAKDAQRETGVKWRDAVRGRKSVTKE
jgi:hypothetical protein